MSDRRQPAPAGRGPSPSGRPGLAGAGPGGGGGQAGGGSAPIPVRGGGGGIARPTAAGAPSAGPQPRPAAAGATSAAAPAPPIPVGRLASRGSAVRLASAGAEATAPPGLLPPQPGPSGPPPPVLRPSGPSRGGLDAPALDVRGVLRKAGAPTRTLSRAGALFQPLLPHAETPGPSGRSTPGGGGGTARRAWTSSTAGGGGSLGTWLKVDPDGRAEPVLVGRRPLMAELGLAPRDLRLLDPQLAASYPSAILARGRALLVRLEHVRAIVTTRWALIQEWEAPAAATFVRALRAQLGREDGGGAGDGGRGGKPSKGGKGGARAGLARAGRGVVRAAAALARKSASSAVEVGSAAGAAPPWPLAPNPHVGGPGPALAPGGGAAAAAAATPAAGAARPAPPPPKAPASALTPARGGTALGVASPASAAALPFELRVVEVALDSVARHFAVAAAAVEAAAGPCLRMPTATKLTTDFLQRLRGVKQRAAVTRIKLETVREVLERLLDDRGAMVAMHLSATEAAESAREAVAAAAAGGGGGSGGGGSGGGPDDAARQWAGLSAAAARLVRRSGGGPLFSRLASPALLGRLSSSGGPGGNSAGSAALAAALDRASAGGVPGTPGSAGGTPAAAAAAAAAISAAATLAAALDRRSLSGTAPARGLAAYLARPSGGSDAGMGGGGGGGCEEGEPGDEADHPSKKKDEAVDPEDAVEMLLETYLATLDAAHARLEALDEHVEGVEDLIDLELDAFRNNNMKLRLAVNAAGLVAFVVFAISGFMAMNLAQKWRAAEVDGGPGGQARKVWPPGSTAAFVLVSMGTAGGSVLALMGYLVYLHKRGLGPTSITTLTTTSGPAAVTTTARGPEGWR